MAGRRESEIATRARLYVHGGRGEDREQCEELSKEVIGKGRRNGAWD